MPEILGGALVGGAQGVGTAVQGHQQAKQGEAERQQKLQDLLSIITAKDTARRGQIELSSSLKKKSGGGGGRRKRDDGGLDTGGADLDLTQYL